MNFLLWTLGLAWWLYALHHERAIAGSWSWVWIGGLAYWVLGGIVVAASHLVRRARNVMPPLIARRPPAIARPCAPRTDTEVESGKGKA